MKKKGLKVFVIAGRLKESLAYSKTILISNSNRVDKVYLFHQDASFSLPKTTILNLPDVSEFWLKILKKTQLIFLYDFIIIFKYILKYRPHIINSIYTIPAGIYGLIISKFLSTRFILSVIGGEDEINTYNRYKRFGKYINIMLLRNSEIITTKGSIDTAYLESLGIDKRKIVTLNGAIDTAKFLDSKRNKEFDIVFAGSFIERKRPDIVVRIIKSLHESGNNLKCLLVGDGELNEEIKKLIKDYYLEDYIILPGYVSDAEKYFSNASIFVMPSKSEGLSTAMLEAMASGCVPVVSNVGNTAEAVLDGQNGFLIDDPEDIQAYVNRIIELILDKKKLKLFSENAVTTVRQKYSVAAQTECFENILDKINQRI